jgi:hypothetical protein
MIRVSLIAALIGASSAAQAQDRVAALPGLEKLCENTVLGNQKEIVTLTVLGIDRQHFCNCVSTQMVSAFSAAEIENYLRSGQYPARTNVVWQDGYRFCLVMQAQIR